MWAQVATPTPLSAEVQEHLDDIGEARDILDARAKEFIQTIKDIKAEKGSNDSAIEANLLAMEQLRFCMAYLDFAKVEYLALINVYEDKHVDAANVSALDTALGTLGKIEKTLKKYPLDSLQSMVIQLKLAIGLQKRVLDAWNADELSQAQAIKDLEFLDQFFAFENGFDGILKRIKWDLTGAQMKIVRPALQSAAVVYAVDYTEVEQTTIPASVTDEINIDSLLNYILLGKAEGYKTVVTEEKAKESPDQKTIKQNEIYEAKMRFTSMIMDLKALQKLMLLEGINTDLSGDIDSIQQGFNSYTGGRNIAIDNDFSALKERLNDALSEYKLLNEKRDEFDQEAFEDQVYDLNVKYQYSSFEPYLKKIKWNFYGSQYSLIAPILKAPVRVD